jgi:hypothetical protein
MRAPGSDVCVWLNVITEMREWPNDNVAVKLLPGTLLINRSRGRFEGPLRGANRNKIHGPTSMNKAGNVAVSTGESLKQIDHAQRKTEVAFIVSIDDLA